MAAPEGNKYAIGNTGGRPPIFKTLEELDECVLAYFGEEGKKTITGLALYLGFCSRQSLEDYVEKKEFSYIIKRAKLAVENSYETSGTAIDIFALKNMGWKDKTEATQTNFNYNVGEMSKEQIKDISQKLEEEF